MLTILYANIPGTPSRANQKADNVPVIEVPAISYSKPKIGIAQPKVLIPVFPGTNCEYDSARAVERAGLKPEIIVCLGRISAMRYIKSDFKVTKEHGVFFKKGNFLMMGTFHPAALLRNPNQKPDAFEDFLKLRHLMNRLPPYDIGR